MYVVVTQKANISTNVYLKSSANLKVTLKDGVRTVVTYKENIKTQYSVYNMMEIKEYTRRAEDAAERAEQTEQEVIEQGDIQIARIIDEGDTQVARVILAADTIVADAQEQAWISEAEAMTSDSYATEYLDGAGTPAEWVKHYHSNNDGTFSSTPVPGTFSSYYWSTKAHLGSEGLTFLNMWDMSGGIYPTTRPPEGMGIPLEVGDYFIVSVAGTTPDTVDWLIGDYAIVTGISPTAWGRYPNVLDWNAIVNVPENVYNAVSRSGDAMTGDLTLNNTIRLMSQKLDLTPVELIKVLADDTMHINLQALALSIYGAVTFPLAPLCSQVPTSPAHLTRKDYVDTMLPLIGGTVTGQIKGITPLADEDLVRKDYVDDRIHLLDGAGIGQEFTFYGKGRIPGFSVALDGSYYSKTIFSELYAALGDEWNEAFGQDAPPGDFFRVPVSQDLLLLSFDSGDNSDTGIYLVNNAIGRVSPIKCMWSSYRVEFKQFVNDDFGFYASAVSGFLTSPRFSNDDFRLNVAYNVGFGDEEQFINDNFSNFVVSISGFGSSHRQANLNFLFDVAYNRGFGIHNRFSNTDFAAYAELTIGIGLSALYSNDDFDLNGVSSTGFTVLVRLSNSNFSVNVEENIGFVI